MATEPITSESMPKKNSKRMNRKRNNDTDRVNCELPRDLRVKLVRRAERHGLPVERQAVSDLKAFALEDAMGIKKRVTPS